MTDKVKITVETVKSPNLRKLARALIALAQQQAAAEAADTPSDTTDKPTGATS